MTKRVRESDATYRAIFDLANEAMFLHDLATGAILEVNQKMSDMYGYSREEAFSLTVEDLSAGEAPYTQQRAIELLRAAAAGTAQQFEWLAKDRAGRLFWVEVNLKHLVIGGHDLLLAIVRDISERKRVEQELRAADEQLREQAALVRLGEMAAVVAHEIKNPLAGVRGVLQVLGSRLPPGVDASILGDAIARLDALDDLMGDVLLFARPPHPHPTKVDVVALAKETSAFASQDPNIRDLRFEVEGTAPIITADPKLLRIVLLNLLLNSAHAMQSRGVVRVAVGLSGQMCRITVADKGPGIPAEIRDRIFVPFFTTKTRGTGLGLPTAKRLVEAHHGRISVDCPPTGGTTVTIELPAA